MAGILINDGIIRNYREYIQNKLAYPLTIHKKYELTFYVSNNSVDCIINSFGVKLYNQKLVDNTKLWLTNITPSAVNDISQIIYDTIHWQQVTIPFVANGTEQYAIIGNFEDSTKLSYTMPCDTSFFWGYEFGGRLFFH